jgi:hypothetical protein
MRAQRLAISLCALYAISSGPSILASEPIRVDDGLKVAQGDWPWWRGPDHNGAADPDQDPPVEFGEASQVIWKSAIPGRGHGSPTVVGSRVFFATANE